jgi:hypothetical protein
MAFAVARPRFAQKPKGPVFPEADGVDGSRSRHQSARLWKRSGNHERMEPPAMEVSSIGLDLELFDVSTCETNFTA